MNDISKRHETLKKISQQLNDRQQRLNNIHFTLNSTNSPLSNTQHTSSSTLMQLESNSKYDNVLKMLDSHREKKLYSHQINTPNTIDNMKSGINLEFNSRNLSSEVETGLTSSIVVRDLPQQQTKYLSDSDFKKTQQNIDYLRGRIVSNKEEGRNNKEQIKKQPKEVYFDLYNQLSSNQNVNGNENNIRIMQVYDVLNSSKNIQQPQEKFYQKEYSGAKSLENKQQNLYSNQKKAKIPLYLSKLRRKNNASAKLQQNYYLGAIKQNQSQKKQRKQSFDQKSKEIGNSMVELSKTEEQKKATFESLKNSLEQRQNKIFTNNLSEYLILDREDIKEDQQKSNSFKKYCLLPQKKTKIFDFLRISVSSEKKNCNNKNEFSKHEDYEIGNGIWSNLSVLERNQFWIDARNQKLLEQQQQQVAEELKDCTFKPIKFTKDFVKMKNEKIFINGTPEKNTQSLLKNEKWKAKFLSQQKKIFSPLKNNNNTTLSNQDYNTSNLIKTDRSVRSLSAKKENKSYQGLFLQKKLYHKNLEELYSPLPFGLVSLSNQQQTQLFQNTLKDIHNQSSRQIQSTIKIAEVVKNKPV